MSCATKVGPKDGPNVVGINRDYKESEGANLERKPSLLELNATNIIGLAILGMCAWAGAQISDNNVAVEKQGVLVNQLNTEVQGMKASIISQGTEQQLLRNDLDHALTRINNVERAQENMENEVLTYLISDAKLTTKAKGN